MVDNIVTNAILPALSRQILHKSIAAQDISKVRITVKDGEFEYEVI